jgi:hypothetical protein
MSSQKSIMRNFTNCKIIMFKLQKHGFWNPILGWNSIFLEFKKKTCLLLRNVASRYWSAGFMKSDLATRYGSLLDASVTDWLTGSA